MFINKLITLLVLVISCLTIKLDANTPDLQLSKAKISSLCHETPYQQACESLLISPQNNNQDFIPSQTTTTTTTTTHEQLFQLSVKTAITHAHSALNLMLNKNTDTGSNSGLFPAMEDCMELLHDTKKRLSDVIDPKISSNHDDIRTWLSTALTNQETCLDGLNTSKVSANNYLGVDTTSENVSKLISNSLALYKLAQTRKETKSSNTGGRKLLSEHEGFPTWVSARERKLLETSIDGITANAVVAKDGSGTHTTLAEALLFASLAGEGGRTVIHVKAGTYKENLKIPSSQKNVMLVGDGKGVTVITGSKNNEDGYSLLQTATFSAAGDGFIARDITFVNSAGPAKHQAVALRVSSDKSVFYHCSIVGYQDTLYTHTNRQFYRETDIYGTVDFIFGNSAVVFQSCNIYARKPMASQKNNFITAQGRTDGNQNTGISIQNCRITATSDLAGSGIKTYLGRPWKTYSRTVIMQSFMDSSIHSSGWYPWSGGSSPKSLYYAEYMNSGPGAATSGRVKWPGYHSSISSAEASGFTVGSFISGNQWLPSTGISYDSGLHA